VRPVDEGDQEGDGPQDGEGPQEDEGSQDEVAIGYEQARCLRATMVAADIDRGQLWLYYFGIGGDVSEFELDAYLHHSLLLPRLQRDLLAQAANEILADLAPPQAPYAADLVNGHTTRAGDCAGQDGSAAVQDGDVLGHDAPHSPHDPED
jgi:hypothetical protein